LLPLCPIFRFTYRVVIDETSFLRVRCALRSAARFLRRINRLAHQPKKLQATDRFSPLPSNLDPLALEVLDRDGQLGPFVVLVPPAFFELDRVELGDRLRHVGFPLALKKNSTREGVQVNEGSRRLYVSEGKKGRKRNGPPIQTQPSPTPCTRQSKTASMFPTRRSV
jgi:hypothetical protein